MVQQDPVGVGRSRGAVVAAVVGALVGAAFGRVWLNIAARGMPEWRAPVEVAGWVVLGLFVVAGLVVVLGSRGFPPSLVAASRPGRMWPLWFTLVVVVEVALIAVGQSVIAGTLGHPEWTAVWVLFVVGAHFWPMALVLRFDPFRTLAWALCAAAVASTVVAGLAGTGPLWSILPGLAGAAMLWGFTGWALYRMARAGSREASSAG